jgi:coenzyme F420-reducing hydrogenase delta subunit
MIRLDCSGRLQPGLILKAFEFGAAGVLVLGCGPRLCHFERGNERAAIVYEQAEALTGLMGISETRLQLAWVPPDDGPAFAALVNGFVRSLEEELEVQV